MERSRLQESRDSMRQEDSWSEKTDQAEDSLVTDFPEPSFAI